MNGQSAAPLSRAMKRYCLSFASISMLRTSISGLGGIQLPDILLSSRRAGPRSRFTRSQNVHFNFPNNLVKLTIISVSLFRTYPAISKAHDESLSKATTNIIQHHCHGWIQRDTGYEYTFNFVMSDIARYAGYTY